WRRLSDQEALLVDGERFATRLATTVHPAPPGSEPPIDTADLLAETFETVAPDTFAGVLVREHPQLIAVTLSHLRARQAAQVLAALPEALQADVVQRMIDLHDVPPEVVRDVRDVLTGQLRTAGPSRAEASTGRTKRVAEIMNAVDDTVEERVFAHL